MTIAGPGGMPSSSRSTVRASSYTRERLGHVAARGERLHQKAVTRLTQRVVLDEPPRRSFRAGELGAAEPEAGCGIGLERARPTCRRAAGASRRATEDRPGRGAVGARPRTGRLVQRSKPAPNPAGPPRTRRGARRRVPARHRRARPAAGRGERSLVRRARPHQRRRAASTAARSAPSHDPSAPPQPRSPRSARRGRRRAAAATPEMRRPRGPGDSGAAVRSGARGGRRPSARRAGRRCAQWSPTSLQRLMQHTGKAPANNRLDNHHGQTDHV